MSIRARRRWLNRLGALILLAGLVAAVAIHRAAAGDSGDALAYEFVDGVAYPVPASESKAYRHDLERFGGKSALFADDLQRGFASLWHGKRLAYTVGALAVAAALACFAAARRLPRDDERTGTHRHRDEHDARG